MTQSSMSIHFPCQSIITVRSKSGQLQRHAFFVNSNVSYYCIHIGLNNLHLYMAIIPCFCSSSGCVYCCLTYQKHLLRFTLVGHRITLLFCFSLKNYIYLATTNLGSSCLRVIIFVKQGVWALEKIFKAFLGYSRLLLVCLVTGIYVGWTTFPLNHRGSKIIQGNRCCNLSGNRHISSTGKNSQLYRASDTRYNKNCFYTVP